MALVSELYLQHDVSLMHPYVYDTYIFNGAILLICMHHK